MCPDLTSHYLVHRIPGSLPPLPVQLTRSISCRTASGSSSEIITAHLLYRKPSHHSCSPRRTANASTSPMSLVVAADQAIAPI